MENLNNISGTVTNNKEIEFKRELASVLNKFSWDNYCNTPDFILSDFLHWTLLNYRTTKQKNDDWHKSKMMVEKLEELTPPSND